MDPQPYQVFLSYADANRETVEALARRLMGDARLSFWFAPWHSIPGEPIQEQTEAALAQSQCCAVFLGGGSTRIEGWQNQEMREAIRRRVEETRAYRVPLARILQEQKEEARLIPGVRRTDEVVYNVPGLGKNYMRAPQHRDLLAIMPDGARVYEFHPWEKKIAPRAGYVGTTVPILEYTERLEEVGEPAREYESIWYYY